MLTSPSDLEHLAMTNSRSNASRTRRWVVLVVLCAMFGASGVAQAGRKRVVVLDFEGPKGDKFHDDLVKLIKKTHTVVPTDKWNGTAEELDAGALSDKNVKKVARRLKVDAIVEGKIEKRRDEFIIRIKLREGKTGEIIGNPIDTKADGPRLEGRARRDLKDELVGAIDSVESNHGIGAAEDGDDRPAGKKAGKQADDDDEPVKKASEQTDDDDEPVKKGFSKRTDDERGIEKVDRKAARNPDDEQPPRKTAKKTDDDELPPRRTAKKTDDDEDDDKPAKPKKVASRDDEAAGAEAEVDAAAPLDGEAALSPGERALDVVLGLSLTARRMSFVFRSDLTMRPPGYRGTPVGGAMIDATVYPLAIGHKRADLVKNLGLNVMYDRVFKINSKDPAGNVYASSESRFGVGAVFRYAFGRTVTSPVVLGSLGYSSQAFTISGAGGAMIGIPNVKYSIIEPGAGLRYPVTPKVIAGVDVKLMLIPSAGQIQNADQYGDASLLGVEGALGVDYSITRNIFARAAFRAETIGYTFKGTGPLSNMRDGDPTTKDVTGARDSYLGGMATVGYLY